MKREHILPMIASKNTDEPEIPAERPDKSEFPFASGHEGWASDYTAECFTTRISLFRTLDTHESVDTLVKEIPQYRLTELTSLDLSSKALTTEETSQIIQAVLRQKVSLKTLALNENRLTAINETILNELTQLNSLNLAGNYLRTLSNGVFSQLTQLNTLNLSFNQLNALSEGMFNGLRQLNILDLRNNQLSTLSESVFSQLTQLNNLVLFQNELSVLSAGMFNGLTRLKIVDFGDNQLSTLSDRVFSQLTQLNTLNLNSNQLNTLDNNILSELNQLRSLHLSWNNFNTTAVMNILEKLPSSLTELDITANPIDYIPKNFSTLLPISLKILRIGGNYIPSTLTREFMQFFPRQLTSFSISYSWFFSHIATECFLDFPTLTDLFLHGNNLTKLSNDVFNGLTQLKSLDLRSNQLSTLSDNVFSQLTQLKSLNLGDNQLSTISNGVFNGLTQLKSLDLNNNQLSTLSDSVFSQLTQLNFLDLSLTQLNTLSDGVFKQLTQLKTLWLFANQLNDFAIKNLTQNFPYRLNDLFLNFNQINNEGMFMLAEIFPRTDLIRIGLKPNPANDTTLALAVQQRALQKVCSVKSTSSLLSSTTSGAMILGIAGLSILLYKNSTWLQAIVSTGSRLFQRWWSNEKTEEIKTVSPPHSVHSRYAFLKPNFTKAALKALPKPALKL